MHTSVELALAFADGRHHLLAHFSKVLACHLHLGLVGGLHIYISVLVVVDVVQQLRLYCRLCFACKVHLVDTTPSAAPEIPRVIGLRPATDNGGIVGLCHGCCLGEDGDHTAGEMLLAIVVSRVLQTTSDVLRGRRLFLGLCGPHDDLLHMVHLNDDVPDGIQEVSLVQLVVARQDGLVPTRRLYDGHAGQRIVMARTGQCGVD
mmetsp:Transcript_38834/g.69497  ORF Transcript_38834/g.69497 Transcript_38834/m.69497 type:complete len:204 (+) Transcript_38834:287-898(+)